MKAATMCLFKHSGKIFFDQRKRVMTEAEADAELPPYLWEFKKAPWFLSLAVNIFPREPQLAPDVAEDVMKDKENIPVSRAALLRIKQETKADFMSSTSCVARRGRHNRNGAGDSSVDTTRSFDREAIKIRRKVAWAKVHAARAMAA
jgi:hypothetical protein